MIRSSFKLNRSEVFVSYLSEGLNETYVIQVVELEIRDQEQRLYCEQLNEENNKISSEYEHKCQQVTTSTGLLIF